MPPFPLSGCVSDTMQGVDGLYAWIDTIPLSRPKKNIARDFADGVLMSEVISHFLPKFVDLHNYPSASSVASRKVNWETLNRRVLLKMGMRVSDETILQLVDAKSGIVEQVLMEVQSKIEQLLQSGNYQHQHQGGYLRSKSQHQYRTSTTDGSRSHGQGQRQGQPLTSSSLNRAFTVSARGKRSRASVHNIVNKKSALLMSPDGRDGSLSPNPNGRFRAVSVPKKNHHQGHGINSPNFKQGYVAAPHLNGINGNGKYPIPPATISSEMDPTLQQKQLQQQQQQQYSLDASAAAAAWQYQQNDPNQKFPAPWDTVEGFLRTKSRSRQQQQQQQHNSNSGTPQTTTATAPLPVPVPVAPVPVRYSNNDFGSMSSRQSVKSSVSDRFDDAPNQIIYRGHKMVPLQFLDEKEREMKNLETINRRLTLKIFRLETLVNIKDQRVEDLTHQLQSYRALYDAVSDKKGLPAAYKKQAAIDAEMNSKKNPLPVPAEVTSLPADSSA